MYGVFLHLCPLADGFAGGHSQVDQVAGHPQGRGRGAGAALRPDQVQDGQPGHPHVQQRQGAQAGEQRRGLPQEDRQAVLRAIGKTVPRLVRARRG